MNPSTSGPSIASVIRQVPKLLTNRLEWASDLQRKYGEVVKIPWGPRVNYAIFHPDHFRHVLVSHAKNYSKGRTFEKTAAYMGKGLATVEGSAWQVQRRRMNPHFSQSSLAGLSGIMVQNTERLLERWEGSCRQGQELDLAVEFQRFALETVARALFGSEVPETDILEIIDAFKVALKHTTWRAMNPFEVPENIPLPGNLRFAKAVELLDRSVYRMIREESRKKTPSDTLLSFLIHAQDPDTGKFMTEKQLRDEVMTLFLGGTDTSGNTLSWVFYHLHQLPRIRKKLLQEIRAVLGNRPPELDDLSQLTFLRRVIQETLRLYPQNWAMSRDALVDDEIGGVRIPAGSTIFLGVHFAHRRADFWPNPEYFDPDRFLPENSLGRHTLSYLPFGAGPRKCIGFQFAMMEFSLAITMILQKLDRKSVV